MEMICLVLCLLCVGVIAITTMKNEKLIKETHSAKREYLNARSNNIKLESHFNEAIGIIRETRDLNSMLREDMHSLKFQVQEQSGLIVELQERVESLEYDNKRLKQKVNIQDQIITKSNVLPMRKTV